MKGMTAVKLTHRKLNKWSQILSCMTIWLNIIRLKLRIKLLPDRTSLSEIVERFIFSPHVIWLSMDMIVRMTEIMNNHLPF